MASASRFLGPAYGTGPGSGAQVAAELEEREEEERRQREAAMLPADRVDPTTLVTGGERREIDPVEMAEAAAAAPKPTGVPGFGKERRMIDRAARQYGDDETWAGIENAVGRIQEGQERIQQRQEEVRRVAEEQAIWQEGQAEVTKNIQNRRAHELRLQQEEIDQAMLEADYPHLSAQRVRELKHIVETGTDHEGLEVPTEVRLRAREELKKGEEIGDKRGIAEQLLGAFAIALGAYGAGMQGGGPNYALQIINKQVERDIAKQKRTAEGRRRRYGREINAYNQLKEKYGDEATAHELAMAKRKEQFANQINTLKGQIQDETKIAQMEQVQAGLLQDAQNAKMKVADRQVSLAGASAELKERHFKMRAMQEMQAGKEAESWLPKGLGVVQGKTVPKDRGSVKKIHSNMAISEEIIDKLDQLISLRQEYGVEKLDPRIINKAQMLAADLQNIKRKAGNLGAHLSRREEEMLQAFVSKNPAEIGFQLQKLRDSRAATIRQAKIEMRPYNIRWNPGWLEKGAFRGAAGVGQEEREFPPGTVMVEGAQ